MNDLSHDGFPLHRPVVATGNELSTIPTNAVPMPGFAAPAVLNTTPTVQGSGPLGLLRALKRRLALALGLAIVVSAGSATAAWYLLPTPSYTAQAKLIVKERPPRVTSDSEDLLSRGEDFRRYQKTQLNLLRTRRVIGTALLDPKISKLSMFKDVKSPVDWLLENLKAEFPQESEVLEIGLDGDNPNEVAAVVNAIQNAYVEEVANRDRSQRVERRETLQKLKKDYGALIQMRRESLRAVVEATGSDDKSTLVLKQQYAIVMQNAVHKELTEVQSKKRMLEAALKVQRPNDLQETSAPLTSSEEIEERINHDPEVLALQSRIAEFEERYRSEFAHTGRIARNANLNPGLKNMREEIEAAKRQLQQKRKALRPEVVRALQEGSEGGKTKNMGPAAELAMLDEVERQLQHKLQELSKSDKTLTDQTLKLQEMQDELKQYQERWDRISRDEEVLGVELEAPRRIEKFDLATPPETRNIKKWVAAFAFITVGSFLATLLGVAFLELQAKKVDSAEEVVSNLGLPVVGSLPMLPSRAKRKGVASTREKDRYWYSMLLESIDATRTMLIHAAHTGSHRVVMISSALSGEGKTSLASHLSTSLARSGLRTLLIDADLRSPSLHRLFDLSLEPGLSEVLRGEFAVEDVLAATAIEELKVITAGKCDYQTLRILSQGGMGGLFSKLRESFDFVIVDSSPILPVADASIIAQQVDAVLLSVLTDVSRKNKIYAAHQRLVTLGVKVLGAVVTGASDGVYGTNYYPGEFHTGAQQSHATPTSETDEAS